MGRRLYTESLTGTLKAPYAKVEIDHIQTGALEVADAIVQGIAPIYTANNLIVLYGVDITLTNANNTATWTKGAVYYNGEIYQVSAGTLNKTGGQVFVYSIVDSLVVSKFSDGLTHDWMETKMITISAGASGSGIADYGGATVMKKSYTSLAGGGGIYIAIDNKMVSLSFTYSSGNKTAGQTIYTVPAAFRTSQSRTLGISFVTYQAGSGAGQEGHCIPASFDTSTGVISALLDMAASHNVVVGSCSYLLD